MKKYLVLYMAPTESFEKALKADPDEMKKGMEEWNVWMEKNKVAIVDIGAPVGKTKKVDPSGASDMRNNVGGFSIVQAESLEEAAKLFENHGHFQMGGGWVEVMEFVDMLGM